MALKREKDNSLPPDLQDALDSVNAILARRSRGEKAISDTQGEIVRLRALVEEKRSTLGLMAAEQVLSGKAATAGLQSRELRDCKEELEIAEAQLQGLQAAIRSAEDELRASFNSLERVQQTWIDAQVRAYESEYDVALSGFFAVVQRGKALASGLGTVLNGLNNLNFPDVHGVPRHLSAIGFAPTWQQDESAMAVNARVADVAAVCNRAKRILGGIDLERQEAKFQADIRRNDQTAGRGSVMGSAYTEPGPPSFQNPETISSGSMFPGKAN